MATSSGSLRANTFSSAPATRRGQLRGCPPRAGARQDGGCPPAHLPHIEPAWPLRAHGYHGHCNTHKSHTPARSSGIRKSRPCMARPTLQSLRTLEREFHMQGDGERYRYWGGLDLPSAASSPSVAPLHLPTKSAATLGPGGRLEGRPVATTRSSKKGTNRSGASS